MTKKISCGTASAALNSWYGFLGTELVSILIHDFERTPLASNTTLWRAVTHKREKRHEKPREYANLTLASPFPDSSLRAPGKGMLPYSQMVEGFLCSRRPFYITRVSGN